MSAAPHLDPEDRAEPRPRSAADALAELEGVFHRWLNVPDLGHVHLAVAAYVANLADGDPVWVLLVGAPSSGKTEALGPLIGLPKVFPAATLTEPALLSGVHRKEHTNGAKGGLLREMGDFGVLALKDFTSTLAQNKDARGALLAALREIYDGSWTRRLGTGGGIALTWSGKCGLVGAVTPAIDQHHSVVGALGDRFLLYRLPEVDPEESARIALQRGDPTPMRRELAQAVAGLLDCVEVAPVDLGDDDVAHLGKIARYIVATRTPVDRDYRTGEVLSVPQNEGPGRVAVALRQVLAALRAIGCDDDRVAHVLAHLGVDAMPMTRRRVIEVLLDAEWLRTGPIAVAAGLPTNSVKRYLEDLSVLGLVQRRKAGGHATAADEWRLGDEARNLGAELHQEVRNPLYSPLHPRRRITGEAQPDDDDDDAFDPEDFAAYFDAEVES